jgi:hypothetical protein
MNSTSRTPRNSLMPIALCGVVTYFLISWSLPEVYPFSSMPMYEGTAHFPVERLVLIDHEQYVVPREELKTVQCWPKVDWETSRLARKDAPRTPVPYYIPYLDKELRDIIHWQTFGSDIDPELTLVRRRFFIERKGVPPQTADTTLSRCVGVPVD